ncbi:MAG: hypothetical protein Q9166_006863 [cf. Caloplaca sp. 2 TL-2023]
MSPTGDRPDPTPTQSKSLTTLAGGKRKREHAAPSPADISYNEIQEDKHVGQLHQLFKDVIEILKSYDIKSSILNHKIPSPSTDAPVTKKAKLAPATGDTTIAQLVDSNGYNSISAFSRDLDSVIASVVENLSTPIDGEANERNKTRHERHPEMVRAMAFKHEFNNIISQELMQRPHLLQLVDATDPGSTNGEEAPGKIGHMGYDEAGKNYSTVLTLYGGSGGGSGQPKQMFSSLKEERNDANGRPRDQESRFSEFGLPNGINFTKIVPVHSEGMKDVPTIGKHFAPPPTVQPLNPPRQSKHTATRSSSVNWYNPAELTIPSPTSHRKSYSSQPLTTGHWLTYNAVPSTRDLSSPESKRKQRDRALSFGEPQSELSERTLALHRQAREDALFRSVYSGFAPNQDNAGALVPQRSKNRLWWARVGEQRYHNSKLRSRHLSSHTSIEPSFVDSVEVSGMEQEMSLEEAVEAWQPEEPPADFSVEEQSTKDKDTTAKGMEEMLNEISELLETLNSYQDVRNLSLTNNARTAAGQNPQLSAMTGTPTSPSSEELDIYNMLKSQLSIMVSSLPPYALAKLDGRKLGVLNINTKIQVETKNHHGSLEEDEYTARARQPAMSATPSYPSRAPSAAVGLASRNNYLAASSTPTAHSQRPSHMPQTAPARAAAPSSYLPNQQYSTRPPSANQYFANNARSSYGSQRPVTSSTPDRYAYGGTQQYTQPNARQSYVNGYNQSTYGQGYAHSQQPSTAGRVPQPSYPQTTRPTQSYGYTATPTPGGGSASPSKAAAQYYSQGYAKQSNTPSQARPQLYHQQSSQYHNHAPASPQVNGGSRGGAVSPPGQQTDNNDATIDVQRQKAQLAEAARRGSGTPQAAIAGPSDQNGTSLVPPNGATAVQNG